MTNNENSGGSENYSKNSDPVSGSESGSSAYSDEELIMELDNMLEEDPDIITLGDSEDSDQGEFPDIGIEAAPDMGLDDSDAIIDLEEDIIDLDESLESGMDIEEDDLSDTDIIESGDALFDDDEIIDLAEDEHILEEITDDFETDKKNSSDDDMLELEDLVSDETLQYDPLLSKASVEELYQTEVSEKPARYDIGHDDIDLGSDDYGSEFDEMDLEITSDMDISNDSFMAAESAVTSGVSIEQIEAAVERVVQRLFIDRMESMLAEVIERVVREELAGLKKNLVDD